MITIIVSILLGGVMILGGVSAIAVYKASQYQDRDN